MPRLAGWLWGTELVYTVPASLAGRCHVTKPWQMECMQKTTPLPGLAYNNLPRFMTYVFSIPQLNGEDSMDLEEGRATRWKSPSPSTFHMENTSRKFLFYFATKIWGLFSIKARVTYLTYYTRKWLLFPIYKCKNWNSEGFIQWFFNHE